MGERSIHEKYDDIPSIRPSEEYTKVTCFHFNLVVLVLLKTYPYFTSSPNGVVGKDVIFEIKFYFTSKNII